MLKLQSLSKTYYPDKAYPVKALDNINLEFLSDEFVSIVGESGSGKSTLLNILGGLDKLDQGEMIVDGTVYSNDTKYNLTDYRREAVGFVFQEFNLISHMTVHENIKLALSTFKMTEEEKDKLVDKAVDDVGLSYRVDNKANELSGGQKQRVAIARALVKNPKVILADEPTGALDSETSAEILQLFESLARKGKLIIIVTHDEKVAQATNRCIRLKDGHVVSDKVRENPILISHEEVDHSTVIERSFDLMSVFSLSFHRVKEKRWRYILISLGISVGIGGFILALALGNGVENFLEKSSSQIIDGRKITLMKEDEKIDDSLYFEVKKTGLAEIIQPEFNLQARLDQGKSTEYFGIKTLHKEKYQNIYATPILKEGTLPKKGKKGIALTEAIAQKFIKEGQSVNSLIGQQLDFKIMSPDTLTHYPSRWDSQKLVITGIVRQPFMGENFAYIPYEDHMLYTKRSRFLGKNASVPTNVFHVYLKDKKNVAEFYQKFKDNYEVITPDNVLKNMTKIFSQFQVAILIVSFLILFISSVMAGILFFISVLERQKEIGLFKALGGNSRDIRWIFFSEAIIIGFMASLMGVMVAGIVQLSTSSLIVSKYGFDLLDIDVQHITIGVVFGVVITAFSALLPANRATKLDPIKLLKQE